MCKFITQTMAKSDEEKKGKKVKPVINGSILLAQQIERGHCQPARYSRLVLKRILPPQVELFFTRYDY